MAPHRADGKPALAPMSQPDGIGRFESPAEIPGPPRPVAMMAEMAGGANMRDMAPPHVEAGQQQIALVVNVTFSLK